MSGSGINKMVHVGSDLPVTDRDRSPVMDPDEFVRYYDGPAKGSKYNHYRVRSTINVGKKFPVRGRFTRQECWDLDC